MNPGLSRICIEKLKISGSLVVVRILITSVLLICPQSTYAIDGIVEKEVPKLTEIRIGILSHDIDNLWSGSKKEGGVDFSAEVNSKNSSISFLSGIVYPNFGVSINNEGHTSTLYVGFLWNRDISSNFFFDLGVGLAIHNGQLKSTTDDAKALGSRILFRIPIEIGYRLDSRHSVYLSFAHISNAYLASPNEGLDTLGIRYGISF